MAETTRGITSGRRFSTVLMVTIITLVTVSVVLILAVVNRHFNRRMEREFQQAELVRATTIKDRLSQRISQARASLRGSPTPFWLIKVALSVSMLVLSCAVGIRMGINLANQRSTVRDA